MICINNFRNNIQQYIYVHIMIYEIIIL
jgi:hypothetical protein